MQILNTLIVLALVVMSFALIVGVPVLYASSEDSGRSNRLILLGGITVVVARLSDLVTGKLLSGCLDCLHRHGVDVTPESSQLNVAWVPGSFELPVVAQSLAQSGRYQVLITLGAVKSGDTPHFDVVVA